MRIFSILSGFALAAVVVAAPTAAPGANHITKLSIETGTDQYRLKLKSDSVDLDGKYLRVHSKVVGIYGNALEGNGVQVTLNRHINGDKNTTLWSLPTYPTGIVEHALGLVGRNGYLEFQDLTQPSGRATELSNEEVTYSWTDFTVGDPNKEGLRKLNYGANSSVPGWIALPIGRNEWKIKHYDGGIMVIQNYLHIKVMLEPLGHDYVTENDSTQ
ncbi:hypothetical protein EDB81DRAFT_796684 [Dactylonectria macrodidyma]|uniref:Uncharacterized protein n=1 Tax=Dactylonectria macrodidyma TaxID=307937 RepID=A0A9P9ESZ2_9HYPO|nr:hypothetical protein EDB81DRAFT_796684 [Dactylonectria macrodidyma]